MKIEKQIVSCEQFGIMIERLAYQLIENHGDFANTILVGIQPRGVEFLTRVLEKLNTETFPLELQHYILPGNFR